MAQSSTSPDDVIRAFAELSNTKNRKTPIKVTGTSGGTGDGDETEPGMVNPMEDLGSLIYGGTAGAPRERKIGTEGQVLTVSAGGVPVWDDAGGGGSAIVIEEGDVSVIALASALDFDPDAFNITESPTGEANIDLNFGTGPGQPSEGDHTHVAADITDLTTAIETVVAGQESVLTWSINEGGVPSLGEKNAIIVPFSATIKRWYVVADGLGDLTLDVWKDTYANWPLSNSDSIVAASKPTLAAASKGSDNVLTGWTTSISLDDVLILEVESAESIGIFTFSLIVERI